MRDIIAKIILFFSPTFKVWKAIRITFLKQDMFFCSYTNNLEECLQKSRNTGEGKEHINSVSFPQKRESLKRQLVYEASRPRSREAARPKLISASCLRSSTR